METVNIAALLLTLAAVFSYLNYRFIKLPTSIGIMLIAIVVAGLLIGNKGRYLAMSDNTRERLDSFWELVDEILNAVLFLLIGLEILVVAIARPYLFAGLLVIPAVLLARFISVALPITLMRPFFKFSPNVIKIMTWGGLRGGISVALVLSATRTGERGAANGHLYSCNFLHSGSRADHQTFDFRQAEIAKNGSVKERIAMPRFSEAYSDATQLFGGSHPRIRAQRTAAKKGCGLPKTFI